MEKASRIEAFVQGVYTLDDHEYCSGMLRALKERDCSLLRSNYTAMPDCIGEWNIDPDLPSNGS